MASPTMAKRTLLALLTLALIATPAQAQTGKVLPGSPSGHCLYVDAGRFFVEARLTGEARQPGRFSLGPSSQEPSTLNLRVSTPDPSNGTVQVAAGVYCYTLTSEPAPDRGGASDDTSQPGPSLALRIIWLPRP
jgi:hypothetical protein